MRYGYIFGIREGVDGIPVFRLRFSGFRGAQSDTAVHERERVSLGDFPIKLTLSIESTDLEVKTHADRLHAITLSWCCVQDFGTLTESDYERFFEAIREVLIDSIPTEDETPFAKLEGIKDNCNINHARFFKAVSESQKYFEKFANGRRDHLSKTISFAVNDREYKGEFLFTRGETSVPKKRLPNREGLPVMEEPTWFRKAMAKPKVCRLFAVVPYPQAVEDLVDH